MPTRTFIDDTSVRTDTPLEQDLRGLASELREEAGGLSSEVGEMATYLALPIDLNMNREELQALLVKLAARAFMLEQRTKEVAAVAEKAAGVGQS